MMPQSDIFGGETYNRDFTKETAAILEKYPAYSSDPGGFLLRIAKSRYAWITQLDPKCLRDLEEIFTDSQTLDRRRREFNEHNV